MASARRNPTAAPSRYARAWKPDHRYLKVVCLGGGHGLHATLEAMRLLTPDITAIVCVGDNGGSSGRLREEFPGILPPGDIRMALSALASEKSQRNGVVGLLQHRFSSDGPLDGHSLGNLMLVAQWQRMPGDVLGAIRSVQRILGIDGTVIPGAKVPLDLSAQVRGLDGAVRTLTGQRRIAKTDGTVLDMSISPSDPEVFPEAVDAIEQADVVTMGPGSWYTSLLVHLLVPSLREALHRSKARKVLIMDLVPDAETRGLGESDEISTFERYSHGLALDAILAGSVRGNPVSHAGPDGQEESGMDVRISGSRGQGIRRENRTAGLRALEEAVGHRTVVLRRPLSVAGDPGVHDRVRLAAGLQDVFDALAARSRRADGRDGGSGKDADGSAAGPRALRGKSGKRG